MGTGGTGRPWWMAAIVLALIVWALGAYVPAISSVWVLLNIATPAGQPNIVAFPLAYPAVGVDAHTLVSLLGLLFVIGGTIRWITYLSKANPGFAPMAVAAAGTPQTMRAPVAPRTQTE